MSTVTVTVLTTPELAPGYRLAGVTTLTADSSTVAEMLLRKLVDERGERGVIAVHEPYLAALEPSFRRRLDELVSPLVVALPSGEETDAAAERRSRLVQMLWQAVGYEITFDQTGGSAR